MAQDPVTQNTATDTGTGDGSRPEDTGPPPGGRQSLTETEADNPPANSGREMISAETEDSLITIYYDWEGLADIDRAMAAYLTAQAFGALGDKRNALAWAQRTLDLDPDDAVYRTYVTDLQGGQRP